MSKHNKQNKQEANMPAEAKQERVKLTPEQKSRNARITSATSRAKMTFVNRYVKTGELGAEAQEAWEKHLASEVSKFIDKHNL